MTFLFTFIILSIINVVFSTIRSITTIKSGKVVASLISGGYFAFYNIMLIYTVAEFPLWQKCVITFGCNVIGVFVVKLVEEKMRKDKLWRIDMTVSTDKAETIDRELTELNIPHCYITISPKHTKFETYCETQKESAFVKELGSRYNARFFATESERLI